jgi:hypothetical protein
LSKNLKSFVNKSGNTDENLTKRNFQMQSLETDNADKSINRIELETNKVEEIYLRSMHQEE